MLALHQSRGRSRHSLPLGQKQLRALYLPLAKAKEIAHETQAPAMNHKSQNVHNEVMVEPENKVPAKLADDAQVADETCSVAGNDPPLV